MYIINTFILYTCFHNYSFITRTFVFQFVFSLFFFSSFSFSTLIEKFQLSFHNYSKLRRITEESVVDVFVLRISFSIS